LGKEHNKYKSTFSFIMATGVVKPLFSTKDSLEIFKISEDFKNQYPRLDTEGKTHVTFILPERNRFYKQFYLGFRLKTYERSGNGTVPLPYVVDMTWGINEAASGEGGHLFRKSVFRLDSFLPLPFELPILKLPVYIFGAVVINASKGRARKPLFLEPAGTDVQAHSSEVLKVVLPDNDRDYFRIGIGINLAKLFEIEKSKNGDNKK